MASRYTFSASRDSGKLWISVENHGVSQLNPVSHAYLIRYESPVDRKISVTELEKTYVYWIRQFILFNGKRHPNEMGKQEIENYLNHLASRRNVSASTQSGALNAIVFLYRTVLKQELPELDNLRRIKRYKSIPVVMSTQEVSAAFSRMSGTTRLVVELIYGTGMRIHECMSLRVKDIDFDLRSITVRAAKGNKDRATLLPAALIPVLRSHLTKVVQLHKSDILSGNGYAPMPNALYRKYPLSSPEPLPYMASLGNNLNC
ncbi:MAG: phage integrase N-terminal SAM-like domain-containing protein [Candidatus Thiodiazotropha sp. 6PLUC2]